MLAKWVTKVILLLVSILTTATLAHVVRSGNNNGARKLFGGYRITPKQCRASKTLPMNDPRATGPTICMFNHECAQRNGEVVGACMDGFLFGACCQIPNFDTVQTTLINNAQNGYYQQKLHNRLKDKVEHHNNNTKYETNAQNTQTYQSVVPQYNTDTKDDFNTDSESQDTNSYGMLHKPVVATVQADEETYMANTANFHVNKDSVNVSSHSSASSNTDDLLLQALHTFAPHEADRISYSTEVPMKITSALVEHTSAESVSFEDEYQSSKVPIKLMEKPQTTTPISFDDVSSYGQQISLLPDSSDFTHSDITHPDADSILVETSSIPSSQTYKISQKPNGTQNKYVLVQTITNDLNNNNNNNNNKKTEVSSTTSSSALTSTHVDSIESIILQLNNSNPGPMYDVEPASANNNYATHTSTMRPVIEPTSKVSETKVGQNTQTKPEPEHHFLNEHTLPEFSYADTTGAEHDTSEFNKMPAQGIAYPVDMSLFDEDGLMTTHKQTISMPTMKPQLPYESLITAQNYHTLKPVQNSQVPQEITVSSHTTKVQEQQLTNQQKPANNPISSSSNQYVTNNNILISSSSMRPSSPSRKPKPPVYRPITSPPDINHKKTTSSQILKQTAAPVEIQQPSNTYDIEPIFENVPLVHTTLMQDAFSTEPNKQESQELLYENENMHLVNSYGQNTKVAEGSQSSMLKPNVGQVTNKPISTSYITGPTSPRPPTTFVYHDNDKVPPLLFADDKLDSFMQSTADTYVSPTYQTPVFISSATPIHIQRPNPSLYNKAPGFVKIQATLRPPVPTVLITPKPTVLTSSSTQKLSSLYNDNEFTMTTPQPQASQTSSLSTLSSISQIYNQLLTRRPDGNSATSTSTTSPVIANDPVEFNEHPAFTQSTTEAVFSVPSDDKPAFPGYYGPTPTYPPFSIPDSEKVDSAVEEETYTSPNDFADFPPVRNPNLNISASSSAVTSELELSTPAFVEDAILKNKMNTLMHKIAESLHGNFEALSEIIDNTSSQAGAQTTTVQVVRRPTTRKPVNNKTKVSTTKPAKQGTKAPVRRTTVATTRRPTATRRPATSTTQKGPTRKSTRKPTRKTTTTTIASVADDVEDEEDVNPSANEVEQAGQVGTKRKIQCGMRPLVKSGRIVGGKGANFGAFPWQVLVRESTWIGFFVKNKCGGVLINDRYVITAAHCKPGFLGSLVAVMGEFDITGELESRRAITKNVRRVVVHNQYDPATFENDLALLELESPVQFDMHIVPICMPPDNADFTGRMATVTGWGRLKYGGGVPSVLQEVQVPIIENSVCQEMFHTAGHNKKILNSFLCAGYANGQKDSCEGDSGGPLVLQRPDGRYELAGTVSHGIKCAAPYLPGVYMRTTFYKPWLRSVTGVK